MNDIHRPRGTQDILPEEQKYWDFVRQAVDFECRGFGFEKIEVPSFEFESLFVRGVGKSTDIVTKEIYEVKRLVGDNAAERDEEKEKMTLRPEYTAGIARAYVENGMQTLPQPIKLYYLGPVFRYDRPQKGRYREFFQYGYEIIGDADASTDATAILLAWQILNRLGINKNLIIEINTIGDKICRPKIRKTIADFFGKHRDELSEEDQRRLSLNPLRILDSKDPNIEHLIKDAPQTVDNLCPACRNHFRALLEYLDELNIPYDLNSRLVRGLDYYTRTVFEIRDQDDTARQASLGGGGRYDELIEALGAKPTPAIGFAGGIERTIEKIKKNKIEVPPTPFSEIFIVQLGDKAKKKCLNLIKKLDEAGYPTASDLSKDNLKNQLGAANRLGAKIALIMGQREVLDGTIIVKDLKDGSQETVYLDDLEANLAKKLKSND